MRLPDEKFARLSVLAVALALTGCGALGGGDRPANAASEAGEGAPQFASGPAADYPMVLGEPYNIDGMEYVPADRMNFDEVGYATIDAEGGISASHKTLPLPSYVEVTSLESGKTILVRVERRGPMTGTRLDRTICRGASATRYDLKERRCVSAASIHRKSNGPRCAQDSQHRKDSRRRCHWSMS